MNEIANLSSMLIPEKKTFYSEAYRATLTNIVLAVLSDPIANEKPTITAEVIVNQIENLDKILKRRV